MTRKGMGSVYKRKDGLFIGSIETGPSHGKRRRKTVSGRTSEEVTDKLKVLIAEQQAGLLIAAEPTSVEAFLADWLENSVKVHRTARTYDQYESAVRVHMLPHLGRVRLQNLSGQIIQRWIGAMLRENGVQTTRYCAIVFKAALNRAVKWGLLVRNPMSVVEIPSARRKETQIWTPEEARAFLAACEGEQYGPLFIVILTLALRKGEALALQWPDVELDRHQLTIRSTLQYSGGKLTRKEPKTASSRRALHLPELAHSALVRQREASSGAKWVFTNGTEPLHPSRIRFYFEPICDKAGVPRLTIHSLRHTTASHLLAQGAQVHVVSKMLGHSSPVMTLRVYAHVLSHQGRVIADMIDEIYS